MPVIDIIAPTIEIIENIAARMRQNVIYFLQNYFQILISDTNQVDVLKKLFLGGLQCQCVLFMKTRMIKIFWDFPNLKSELLSVTLFLPFLGGKLLKLRRGVQKRKWEKFTFVTTERAEISGWKLTRIHLRLKFRFPQGELTINIQDYIFSESKYKTRPLKRR